MIIKDTVCASGHDTQGGSVGGDVPPGSFCDDATVTVSDVPSDATLTKTVTSADVTYEVVVTNTSAVDTLSLKSLCDDKFGDISGNQGSAPDCPAPAQGVVLVSTNCPDLPMGIAKGDNVTCQFVGRITSSNTDTVTGKLTDDAGKTLTRTDSATVNIP
jgi:hypothetical protein